MLEWIFMLASGIYLLISGIYKIKKYKEIDIKVNKLFYNFIKIKDKKMYCKLFGQSECFDSICILSIYFIGCKLNIIWVIYTFGVFFLIGKIYFFIIFMKVIGLK